MPFPSSEDAEMVKQVIEIDEEPSKGEVERVFEVVDTDLVTFFCNCLVQLIFFIFGFLLFRTIYATELKLLRVSTSGFYDMISVAVRTLCEFKG